MIKLTSVAQLDAHQTGDQMDAGSTPSFEVSNDKKKPKP